MKISVKINNGDSIVKGFAMFGKIFLTNATKAAKSTNKNFKEFIQDSMNSDWPLNEKDYLTWKSTHGYATRPLFRTSLLHNSVSHEIKWGQDFIKGQIGWHEGARYPGKLKGKIWKGRVPNRRKKDLPAPSGMLGDKKSEDDTNYLAQVALWNEKGTEGVGSTTKVPYRMKNGFRRNKSGTVRQRYKTRYYEKFVYSSSGRPPRPFVERAFSTNSDLPFVLFSAALDKTLVRTFKTAGKSKPVAVVDSVPF